LPKTSTASATAEAAPARVRYRVLPKGAGLIYTGEHHAQTGEPFTFAKGEVVKAAEAAIAAELEDRGMVEVLGPA
jgi:hypothetical protein